MLLLISFPLVLTASFSELLNSSLLHVIYPWFMDNGTASLSKGVRKSSD